MEDFKIQSNLIGSIKKNISIMFFSNIFGRALLLVANIILNRLLTAEVFGAYVYVFSLVQIIVVAPMLGLNEGLLKYIPRSLVNNDNEEAKSLATFSIIITAIIGLLLTIVFFSSSGFISKVLFGSKYYVEIVQTFSLYLLVFSTMIVVLSVFQARRDINLFALGRNFIEPILFLLVAICLFYVTKNNIVLVPVYAKLVASFATLYIFISLLYKKKYLAKIKRMYLDTYKALLKYSFPLFLNSTIAVIITRVNILIVGNYLSKTEIAVFNAAAQYALLGSFLLIAVNQVFMPVVSSLFFQKKMKELKNLYQKITLLTTVLSVSLLVIVIFAKDFLMGLYGSNYIIGSNALIIIMVGQVFNSAVGPCGNMITIMSSPKYAVYINIFLIILNIIIGNILTVRFGINGAAFSMSISLFVASVIRVYILYKKHDILPYTFKHKNKSY